MQPSGAVQDALRLGCQVGHGGLRCGGSCCCALSRRSQVDEVSVAAAEGRIWLRFPRPSGDWPEMLYLQLETKYLKSKQCWEDANLPADL